MKRTLLWFSLSLTLLLAASFALADANHFCDEIPQGVAALQTADDNNFIDCIVLDDSQPMCWLLTPWNLDGYLLENGAWKPYAQLSPLYQENAPALFFRRHAQGKAEGLQGEAGLTYPDEIGFDLVRGDPNASPKSWDMLQYHNTEDGLALIGWQKDAQFALLQDASWCFYDTQSGSPLGSARIDVLNRFGSMSEFDQLPSTLAEAKNMEAITRRAAAALFPGWEMASYSDYNWGHGASAGYYRVDGGCLTVRRVELSSNAGGVSAQYDTVPVPLSQTLLARMQTEPFETLIDTGGYSDTFLTDDFADGAQLPISGKVLQNDLQSHGLLLLTEDGANHRFLVWITRDKNKYAFHTSGVLPGDATLDLLHDGDGKIGLEWDHQRVQCGAKLATDGTWITDFVMGGTEESTSCYGSVYCGVTDLNAGRMPANILVGSQPWYNLFTMDIASLSADFPNVKAALDREGWAVVSNPDPADRLHLRVKPDRNSASLGKFYNRTPVQVLKQQGEWTKVRIGLDGRLEGWMLSQYLTFGDAMDSVASASPDKTVRAEHEGCMLYAADQTGATTGVAYGGNMWITGAVEDDWYILLDESGNTGYLPQSWLWSGNG